MLTTQFLKCGIFAEPVDIEEVDLLLLFMLHRCTHSSTNLCNVCRAHFRFYELVMDAYCAVPKKKQLVVRSSVWLAWRKYQLYTMVSFSATVGWCNINLSISWLLFLLPKCDEKKQTVYPITKQYWYQTEGWKHMFIRFPLDWLRFGLCDIWGYIQPIHTALWRRCHKIAHLKM